MSALPHIDDAPALSGEASDEAAPVRVLFVGHALAPAVPLFARRGGLRALHVETLGDAADALAQVPPGAVDRVVIDQRPGQAAGHPLHVVRLAAVLRSARLVVLTSPGDVPLYETIPHVEAVLTAPVAPADILAALKPIAPSPVPEGFEATPTPEPEEVEGPSQPTEPTEGFETTLSRIEDADRFVWSKFVPVANFLYKKLAIIVLSSLFLAFATYGVMIVFFMVSSSWSVPFELSPGHALVEKTQRDISSLAVRRNALAQELSAARTDLARSTRDGADAASALLLTQQAIREELAAQGRAGDDLRDHIRRLKSMITDFSRIDGSNYARDLQRAYQRRLITKKHFDTGTLQVLETMHRLTTVNNELAAKVFERSKVQRRVEFLRGLVATFGEERPQIVVSAGSDLVHFAHDLIRSRNRIDAAQKEVALARKRLVKVEQSLGVVEENLASLRATPAARALHGPVAVLFVPYTNGEAHEPGTALYACAFQILWCREAGRVGPSIGGETTVVHPLFGKPVRGTFAEALFSDGARAAGDSTKFVTKELIHAGRAPLFL